MRAICILLLLATLIAFVSSACTAERCCFSSPCTSSYCTQKNSETWNSTQNFASYGYTKLVLGGSQCVPCSYNCQSCSSEAVCSTCLQGFYMTGGQCTICSYGCLSCVVANGISKCSSCTTGTYLVSSTASCSNCATGASACSSATVITACKTGYMLTSNSLFCLPCPNNCSSCPSSNSACTSCATGFYLNSSLCYPCTLSKCATCSFVSSKQTCTSCSSGYYVSGGSCNACSANCLSCSSTACSKCATGFYLIAGGCVAISSSVDNCNGYSSSTACSTCLTGYYLSSSMCQPCSILCSACYGLHFGQCTACNLMATLFNQMCLPTSYLANTQYQLYFAYPSAASLLSGGTSDCNRYLYSGQKLTLSLTNLAGYKVSVSWRLFSLGGSTTYTVSFNNSAGTQSGTFTTSGSAGSTYSLCSSNASTSYSLSVGSMNFTTVKVNNTLTFSTNNGITLGVQEVLVVVDMCNSLCAECSTVLCTQCLLSNLYTQDAYCVYTCSTGYYLFHNASSTYDPNSCVQQCPVGTYALSTNLTCQSCISPCLSCLNDHFCLSCVADYFLTQANDCQQICPYQYFGEVLTQTCQKCVGRCNECLDQLRCLNCNSGFFYAANHSCLDSCSPAVGLTGLYADLTALTCLPCASTCLNCIISASTCTSCPSGKSFFNSTCLTSCPTGYYADASLICQLCTYPCESCSSATACISCVDRYLLSGSCLVDCPVGYFQDNQGLICTACAAGCKECVNTASYCTQCVNGYYSFNNTCVSSCPAQYYPNATLGQCLGCAGLCYTCLNATYCLACSSNFLLNGSCVANSQCSSSHYADMKTLSCLSCSSPCLSCEFSPTYCTACSSASSTPYLLNNTCVSSCTSAYYYASTVNAVPTCVACSAPCSTCLNATYCLSCLPGYMFSGGVCSTACTVGYYFNASTVDCSACSSDCLICNSGAFCQLCRSGYYIFSLNVTINQCLSACPAGYYANAQGGSCQPCLYPCLNCTSSLDCLACQTGVLYQSRCISACPDTTYLNLTAATCLSCQGNCLTCFSSATNCLSCQNTYFLYTVNNTCISNCYAGTYPESVTQMCLQCPSSCLTCSNDTYCTACLSGRTYLYTITNNCITDCPLGYFGNATAAVCSACIPKCLTCSGTATNCLSCSNGYYLVRLSVTTYDCLVNCPSGYYQQGQNCYACIFPCSTCSSASSCLTCVTGTYFFANASSCLLSCPTSSFIDSATTSCISCQSPCVSCKSKTFCLSCTTGLYLNGGSCVSSCPLSTYSDTTLICLPCSGLCSTCSSKYYCISCLTGYLSNGFCYNSCPPGTYADLKATACVACLPPCVECLFAANYCTRCQAGLVQFQGNCSSSCPVGTYVSDSACLDCSFPCINCTSGSSCSECLGGYLLYNQLTCINDTAFCPNDFFKMDGKYCIPQSQCPINYFVDQAQRVCASSCPAEKYVDNETKTCNYNCRTDQYVGAGMVCQNYSSPPASLMAMTVISFIRSSVVTLAISFNESEVWLNSNSSIYAITTPSRLLYTSSLAYTLDVNDPTTLLFRVKAMPTQVTLTLPAQNVISSSSGYPLQTPNVTVSLPKFLPYQYGAIYQGYTAQQFGEGLGWFILLLTLVFLFKNRISHLYMLWDTVQLLYVLLFLDIQYPPTLNEFLRGLNSIFFSGFPSFFPVPKDRMISDRPFYAYATDCSFLRNAGFCISLLLFVVFLYFILRLLEWAIKHTAWGGKLSQTFPRFKKFVFEMLLRYRWHYASDVFFLTYTVVCLFAVSELAHAGNNPSYSFSKAISAICLALYALFPIFVSTKLYRHFPNISKGRHVQNLRCFYRGIDKSSKFGVFLVVIRYFRKMVYALAVGIFSAKPMYALPILMMVSGMLALFIFVHLPYKKRLSNIVETVTEACIAMLFLGLALVNFNNQAGSAQPNITLGYLCTALLILILLLEVFEIFCRSLFHLESEEDLRKKHGGLAGVDEDELRKKAGEFFDFMFPRIRQEFGFGEDSEDEVYHYEEGDSQNSENNEERQRQWGIQSSAHSEEFRHYDNNSESEKATEPKQAPPEFLVRCVKDLQ